MRIPQYGNYEIENDETYKNMTRNMTPSEKAYFDWILGDIKKIEEDRIRKGIRRLDEFEKVLYMVDMVQGFVNIGAMSNKAYNALVPEQLRLINKFRKENELVTFINEGHDENAAEFLVYPEHCKDGTEEALLIPEFRDQIILPNTQVIKKNCINGLLVPDTQEQIRALKNLKEVVFAGVCTDLCVMDFVRTYARFLDMINHPAKLFVVKSAIDTFDAPGHNRDEWTDIAIKVMTQAGVEVVENFEHLEEREKQLGLYKAA